MIAVLREEYVNPWKDLERWGRRTTGSRFCSREELERIWEAWVRILKNMPVGSGETRRQLEGGEGGGDRAR